MIVFGGAQAGAVTGPTHRFSDFYLSELRPTDLHVEPLGATRNYITQIQAVVQCKQNFFVFSSNVWLPSPL